MMADLLPLDRQNYVRLTFKHLWEDLPQILLACLVFSLGWLPAFVLFVLNLPLLAILVGALTIAPAWAVVLAHEARLLEHKAANLGTMAQTWRRYGLRSAKLGLLAAFPLVAGLLTLPHLAAPEAPPVVWLGLAADALGLLLLVTLFLYAFPLLVLFDMKLRTALYNSLILASRYLANTLGLLSLGGLFLLGVLYLNSGLLFILPAIWGMFIVNNCRLVINLEEEDFTFPEAND
jgi:uncharacterized membrane protein YesL